jgi:hypothetical protein
VGLRVDVLEDLWQVARQLRHDPAAGVTLPDVETAPEDERPVARAVAAHLAAVAALRAGATNSIGQQVQDILALWDRVEAETIAAAPRMTPRSHAFHMRLAARHGDFYRGLEHKALLHWIEGARLKARFLHAIALHRSGDANGAIDAGLAVATAWRSGLPPRLPGLAAVEDLTAQWAGDAGRTDIAGYSDRLSAAPVPPWPEDTPRVWARPRSREAILRFGFTATPITWPSNHDLG